MNNCFRVEWIDTPGIDINGSEGYWKVTPPSYNVHNSSTRMWEVVIVNEEHNHESASGHVLRDDKGLFTFSPNHNFGYPQLDVLTGASYDIETVTRIIAFFVDIT